MGERLIIAALLLAAPTRKMDGDVGGQLDRLRQDLNDRLYTCSRSEVGRVASHRSSGSAARVRVDLGFRGVVEK
jgi:hypothetical protein